MFWVTFLVTRSGAYYTKNVIIAFKILISKSKCWLLVHHDAQKIKKVIKIYWASGNKVLDTFSTIQYMIICCLCHANIIMLSTYSLIGALKFESGSIPSDKNVTQNIRPSLYTYVKVWARDYSCITLLLVSESKLGPESPSEALLHVC